MVLHCFQLVALGVYEVIFLFVFNILFVPQYDLAPVMLL